MTSAKRRGALARCLFAQAKYLVKSERPHWRQMVTVWYAYLHGEALVVRFLCEGSKQDG
jgi:hypothetical protein